MGREASGQDGGIDRHALPHCTTIRGTQLKNEKYPELPENHPEVY